MRVLPAGPWLLPSPSSSSSSSSPPLWPLTPPPDPGSHLLASHYVERHVGTGSNSSHSTVSCVPRRAVPALGSRWQICNSSRNPGVATSSSASPPGWSWDAAPAPGVPEHRGAAPVGDGGMHLMWVPVMGGPQDALAHTASLTPGTGAVGTRRTRRVRGSEPQSHQPGGAGSWGCW